MLDPKSLLKHGGNLLLRKHNPELSQADLRRAISACYYSVFHLITLESASRLTGLPNAELTARVRRRIQHSQVRALCQGVSATGQTVPKFLRGVLQPPISTELLFIADAVIQLQSNREAADYEIEADISPNVARACFKLAADVFKRWSAIEADPNTHAFLVALILADPSNRRG